MKKKQTVKDLKNYTIMSSTSYSEEEEIFTIHLILPRMIMTRHFNTEYILGSQWKNGLNDRNWIDTKKHIYTKLNCPFTAEFVSI